ncbi:MAG: hypothetical protein AMJ88_14555 [Anaerolineae bacterium SM23_ 63]|nr:MAG: hypothetical protein AMJ88_14555 [Anaerolineae bacterium SM23_ 63]HEY46177.1 hypothetical protein [Anaerolineae bacterium]
MNKQTSRWGSKKWPQVIGTLLLTLAILYQLIQLIRIEILPLAKFVMQRNGANATERSALFFAGKGFSDFITFVNENVPLNGTVFIPRFEQNEIFGHEGIMEFFLFPRKVENCSPNIPVEECILNLRGPNKYILAVEGYPPRSAAVQVKEWVPFDGEQGIYIPPP